MDKLPKYMRKARMSKSCGFDLPIVATPEDALRLARAVADSLQATPPEERLPLLSDLTEFKALLDERVAHLDRELETERDRLRRVRVGRQVCGAYANVASLDVARARRRPQCP